MLDPTALKTAIDTMAAAGNALIDAQANASTTTLAVALAARATAQSEFDAMVAAFETFQGDVSGQSALVLY
jgi:hypothetical protein